MDIETEDVGKIQAEVSQIANQRFLITTLAVSVFGLIGAWLIPKNAPVPGSEVGGFAFAGSTLLTSVLLILFLFAHFLKGMLRIFTTYLLVTGRSNWENDWQSYRKKHRWYVGYTRAQTLVFLVLGCSSTAYPFLLAEVYSLSLAPATGLWIDLIAGLAYVVLVIGMGFFGLWDPEKKAMDRWKAVLTPKVCPHCGNRSRSENKFCPQCGKELPPSS